MEWISIFKCPVTGNSLVALKPDELKNLNQKASEGLLLRADGNGWIECIEKALATADGAYVYPVVNEIVVLLKDFAIVDSIKRVIKDTIDKDKLLVQSFYDNEGWIKDREGNYQDAVIYEDLREVSKEYLNKCHDRVNRYLPSSGKYLLDAASGAIQYSAYLQYSAKFKYRVCIDLSFKALIEAKKN